ncbi:mid region of cactin-domain-containing protein [Spinellus fusiger]|nr:mid region of cactin-domain-containing protein [Spinellus fusiger]
MAASSESRRHRHSHRHSHRSRSRSHSRSRSRQPHSSRHGPDKDNKLRDSHHKESKRKHRLLSPEKSKKRKSKRERTRDEEEDDEEDDDPKSSQPSLDALGYSNVNNPFNDVNLESKFIWSKKKDRDRKELGLTPNEVKKRERDRRRETEEELSKLNKRRAEREIEMQLREEEMARMQRDAELAQMGDWQAKEEEFHLEQAKRRAEIRIREGRAKPIDILAMNLRLANEPDKVEEEVELEIDLEEPYTIFDNLTLEETEELHHDIQMHLNLEKNEKTLDFWRALIVVADDQLAKLKQDVAVAALGGVAESVHLDIQRVLSGKTVSQLTVLQDQILRKLRSNEPVDVEYWENLLKELVVFKAKAKLNSMHQELLAKRLNQLRMRQREEALKVQEELERVLSMQATEVYGQGVGEGEGIPTEPVDKDLTEEQDKAFESLQETPGLLIETYNRSMSPEPMARLNRDDRELEIVEPIHDLRRLMDDRRKVLSSKIIPMKTKVKPEPVIEKPLDESVASVVLFEQEAAKGIDEDEAIFNIEAELAKQTYMWQDKYRPRKPRYFNRVHTGYEWNKYNQTHYDHDNPPPKVVQGYKQVLFNIFYPDLIDKSIAPTYYIEKDLDSPETVLIRFRAGPPYEDIAFRIVNREWEYSHKKGFKCSFDRGVLSLWFHFKRQFYRK